MQAAVPAAELVEAPWEWDEPMTGRLLFVDRESVLMSTLPTGDGPAETAIWGTGAENSLVVVLETIVDWWLSSPESELETVLEE